MKRVVGAIIEHPKYGFLLQLRSVDDPDFPLQWSIFGGSVENGEKDIDALYRELHEELLLKKEMMCEVKELATYTYRNMFQTLYYVKIDVHPEELLQGEGADMMFVNDLKKVIHKFPFAYNVRFVLDDYCSRIRKMD
jgi:8-oxo-dGTP pyrophosphatase MutT (NUDIX family)